MVVLLLLVVVVLLLLLFTCVHPSHTSEPALVLPHTSYAPIVMQHPSVFSGALLSCRHLLFRCHLLLLLLVLLLLLLQAGVLCHQLELLLLEQVSLLLLLLVLHLDVLLHQVRLLLGLVDLVLLLAGAVV